MNRSKRHYFKEVIPMSGRWRHPNRTQRETSRRPRYYKAKPKIIRRVEENLDEYRQAARVILEMVKGMEI
jgi:hypothetical protein